MSGLNKEIWIASIMEQYQQKQNFLDLTVNLSPFVENHAINLAEVGNAPSVVVDNTSYPVSVSKRTDIAKSIVLKTYDTEASHLPRAANIELSYDKMQSVISGHTEALFQKEAQDATYAFAPISNSSNNPIVKTTGDADSGFAQITEQDILDLATSYDAMNVPDGERVLVLHATHYNQLLANSEIIRGQVKANGSVGIIPQVLANLYGFEIVKYRSNTLYNVSDPT